MDTCTAISPARPEPVARFALAGEGGHRAVETVVIETRAWMSRPGMPRIPLEIRMAHRLGYEFVHDIRIGRGRLSFRFGLDAYVGGHGLMKVGPAVHTGVEFDQGALIALWGEALGFPAAWETRTDIRWDGVDERHGPAHRQGTRRGDPDHRGLRSPTRAIRPTAQRIGTRPAARRSAGRGGSATGSASTVASSPLGASRCSGLMNRCRGSRSERRRYQ